jgi:hypothetical protein
MLNPVQHDNGGEFRVTLNLFQGLPSTETPVLAYGLWYSGLLQRSPKKMLDKAKKHVIIFFEFILLN